MTPAERDVARFVLEALVAWCGFGALFAFVIGPRLKRVDERERAMQARRRAQAALRRSWEREQEAMDLPPASAVLGRADGLVSRTRPFDAEVDGL